VWVVVCVCGGLGVGVCGWCRYGDNNNNPLHIDNYYSGHDLVHTRVMEKVKQATDLIWGSVCTLHELDTEVYRGSGHWSLQYILLKQWSGTRKWWIRSDDILGKEKIWSYTNCDFRGLSWFDESVNQKNHDNWFTFFLEWGGAGSSQQREQFCPFQGF